MPTRQVVRNMKFNNKFFAFYFFNITWGRSPSASWHVNSIFFFDSVFSTLKLQSKRVLPILKRTLFTRERRILFVQYFFNEGVFSNFSFFLIAGNCCHVKRNFTKRIRHTFSGVIVAVFPVSQKRRQRMRARRPPERLTHDRWVRERCRMKNNL